MQTEGKLGKEWQLLALVVLLGLGLRLAGGFLFPLWSGPEEGAHFTYVQYIAENNALPMVELSEEAYASLYSESIYQPPFYYLMAAPFYSAVSGLGIEFSAYFLRLLSVAFGTACIALTYAIAKMLSFGKRVRIGSAVFVALLPTHIVTSSTISNSPLSWLLCLAVVFFSIRVIKDRKAADMASAGLLMLATVLTMYSGLSVAIAYAIAGLVFLLKGEGSFLKRLAIFAIPVAAAPVLLRNIALSGKLMPGILGSPLKLGLPWLVYYLTHLFPGIWLQEYGTATIPDIRFAFFGFFAVVSLTAFVGFAVLAIGKDWSRERKFLVGSALALPILLNFVGITFINMFGRWPDGRWMLTTIGFAAILFIAGQQAFAKMVGQEKRASLFIWLILFALLLLDIILLVNYNRVLPSVLWSVPG